jgi:hypothetical protein
MSCHNMGGGGRRSKKRIIAIISGAGIAVTGIAYVSLATNPVAAAVIPAILAAMGGAMWLNRRISKRKNQTQVQQPVVNSKEEGAAEVKTESIDSNQQVAYQHKRRKGKTAAQDTCAISN